MAILPEVKSHYGKLKFYIDNQWVESASSEVQETTNPATGRPIAEYPTATRDEARAAVESAQRGFKAWNEIALRERAKTLFDMRQAFEEDYDVLCRVLTQDHGRTMGESRGSVRRVIENIESACAACYAMPKLNEHIDQLATGIDEYLIYEPLGVFLIVTPGNIPMHAWSSFVPYALAAGCSVVVSPSRQDPVAAEYITRTIEKLNLPPGLINLVHGGRQINDFILRQPEVQGVGFIGSTAAGQALFKTCGELGKSSSLNGNGKNCVVIMPDADLDIAAQYLLRACFGMTGQRCLGSDNVLVHEKVFDQMKEKFVAAAKAMKIGYGLDESMELGPHASRNGMEKTLAWIDKCLSEGGKLALDGRETVPAECKDGYFVGATIFEDVTMEMEVTTEESFGPLACLMRFNDLDKVIEWHNKANYDQGHSACIMTADNKAARKFIREMETGNIGVNVAVPQPYSFFPLASKKQSFLGNAKSRYASMRLFLDEKTVTSRWV